MSLRLRWYSAEACSVDLRLAGIVFLTRCACANAALACLVFGLLLVVCHVGFTSFVSVCLVYVIRCCESRQSDDALPSGCLNPITLHHLPNYVYGPHQRFALSLLCISVNARWSNCVTADHPTTMRLA